MGGVGMEGSVCSEPERDLTEIIALWGRSLIG